MYALTVLLSLVASAAFARMSRSRTTAGGGRSASRWRSPRCCTRTTGRCSSAPPAARAWLFLLVRAPAPERRRPARSTAPSRSAGRCSLYLPWIPITLYQAAHTGAPWAESPTVVGLLAVARADARPVRADRAAARGRRRPGGTVRAPRRPAVAARPRGRLPARDLGPDRAAGVGRLAGSRPRGRTATSRSAVGPLLLAARRRARRTRAARDRRPRGRGRAGGGDTAPDDKSNVREVAEAIAPEPGARRPRRLHPARAGAGARLLPAGRRAVRDAHRRGAGHRRHGLARRRRAARRDLRRARPRAAARRPEARPASRARDADLRSTSSAGRRRGPSSCACARASGASTWATTSGSRSAPSSRRCRSSAARTRVQATVLVKTAE